LPTCSHSSQSTRIRVRTHCRSGNCSAPAADFGTVGASLTQTLFDAGALLHEKRAADAALDQAAAQYRAAVILACQNVADTLRALQADAESLKASAAAERAAKRTFELAQSQQKLGTLSLVAVLNAEQTYQQAQMALIQARASRYSDTAALFQALGGVGGIVQKESPMNDLVRL